MPVDAAVVNDRIFLNTSSVGAYVTFVRARERLEKRLGYHIASLVAGMRLLFRMPTVPRHARGRGRASRISSRRSCSSASASASCSCPRSARASRTGKTGLHVMVVRERSGGARAGDSDSPRRRAA